MWFRHYNEVRPHGAIGNNPLITLMNCGGEPSPPPQESVGSSSPSRTARFGAYYSGPNSIASWRSYRESEHRGADVCHAMRPLPLRRCSYECGKLPWVNDLDTGTWG